MALPGIPLYCSDYVYFDMKHGTIAWGHEVLGSWHGFPHDFPSREGGLRSVSFPMAGS